jgi:tetratricopeptide (TPR) repeat protein
MTFSRTKGLCLLLFALVRLPSEAKEDPVDLIRRHRYDEAILAWDKDLDGGKADEKSLRALKGKSLAYFRLGSLYGNYSGFSSAIMAEYYTALVETGAGAIHYLYLGQIQYQSGKIAEAKASFEKAKKLGGAGPGVQEMVDVFLFFTRKRLGEVSGDLNPGVKDNASQWQAMELKGAMAADIPPSMAGQAQRSRRCKLRIQLRSGALAAGELENTLKAVLNDAQQPEMYLDQGKNTQINFYDPFLLETISDAYYTLSKLTNLRIKGEEKRFPDLAAKFNTDQALAEANARLGLWKDAAGNLPKDGDIESQLIKAQVLAHTNKVSEAKSVLESLSMNVKSPPDQKDIADCYYLLGFDLDKGLKLAGQAVREKNGPNYYRTYANLLFATGQTESAMQQYAKGYKIEYRNRIDQIDPEYMTDYAFAIFRTNKLRYEEIVETLYHLQKEFPACRQMHYCMQGISAGLARSYESQRIFRKGG